VYRVERCQGVSCTSFVEIGTSTVTAYSDSNITAVASYQYRVRAGDAAGNLSAYSSIASANVSDTIPPSAPGSLSATAASASRINVAWTSASDNVGVTGYRVERCQGSGCSNFAQVATTTTALTYNNTGLANGATYSYRIRATDAAGNLGPYSAIATASTFDTQAPTAPGSPSSSAISSSQIRVTWTASTDNGGVTVYRIERCQGNNCNNFAEVGTSSSTNFDSSGLTSSTTYRHRVRAADAAGNFSSYSATVSATTFSGPDTQPPSTPSSLSATAISGSQINLAWSGATDNVGVTMYLMERCQGAGCTTFAEIGASSTTSYNNTGLAIATTYRYRVRATDAAGNLGGYSPVAAAATLVPPQLSITQPGAGATIVGASVPVSYAVTGDLTEVNHVHFQVDNGPIVMDMSLDGSYLLTNVAPGSHVLNGFLVRADHSKISGTDATPVNFTTVADTQPPTAPGGLSAAASSSSRIDVTWTAATDDAGVAGYRIERCQGSGCSTFTEIGIVTTTVYTDTPLAPSTTYSYRVRAADEASNLGPYSAVGTATTQSAAPPVPISYVQGNYAVPQTPQSVVTVAFTSAQSAGDLNVVAIGWNDATSQVVSVTDARGNTYTRALATVQPTVQSHIIYFARNIVAAPTNSVTVTFNGAVSYPDVRIAEYRGIDTVAPLDGAIGAYGFGTTSSSGSVTTTTPNALLLAANYVQTFTSGAGTGYTLRLSTSPNGSILEDRIATATGSYTATAPMSSSGGYVMQLVAFRGATGGGTSDTEAPAAPASISATAISSYQIDVTWPAATDNVGVTSYRIERCQGVQCSTFTEIATATTLSFSNVGLTVATSYSYRVRAVDAAGNIGPYSPVATAITAAPTPMSLEIYVPSEGAALSGSTTFGVVASGNVAGVQFMVDNVNVGSAIVPTQTISVNTAKFTNGSHLVKAYGWDLDRNIVTAVPVSVTLSNVSPGNPAQTGLWSGPFVMPLVSINVSLLNDGRVLMYDRMNSGNPDPFVWDPLTSSFIAAPTNDGTNLFCSGQITLRDGRILVVGGHLSDHVGTTTGRIFDPATNQWSSTPDMTFGRWYPTLTVLPDGRVLTLSGETTCKNCYATQPEVYDPVTNTWSRLSLASLSLPYYPHAFVIPNGKVVVTGTAEKAVPARVLDVGTQTWSTVDARLFDAYSSAMYLPGKILKTGTSTDSESTKASAATAYVIDMTAATPQWRQVSSMAYPRAYHVETLLPDGTVLVTGGGTSTWDYGISDAVYAAELWSPGTETWTTLAFMQSPRMYHGSALLLADGRVLVAGGGRSPGPDPRDQENYEIFAPPYLFKGPRPTISSVPSQLGYNQGFTIQTPEAARIVKVTLVAPGNMTHGINMSQRTIPLSFTVDAGRLTVTAPNSTNVAPPGIYMLFIIDDQGVPSVASFVKF